MKVVLSLFLLMISTYIYGQELHRRIVIKDSISQKRISNSTLIVKGAHYTSDKDGVVDIVANVGDTIEISHIGYENKRIGIKEILNSSTIVLLPIAHLIEEVDVYTGYQKINLTQATGAFEKVNMKNIKNIYSSNILDRLEGNSALLFTKNNSKASMTLRGLSSINNSNLPLIVLDDFPYDGDLNNINAEDVANISILKDAAATAIWGARAGNGVIVITTKKASTQSKGHINLSSAVQLQTKPDLYGINQISASSVIDLETYLFEKGAYSSAEKSTLRPYLSPVVEALIAIRDNKGDPEQLKSQIDAMRENDVRSDYLKYMYRNAINSNYNFSIDGANNKFSFLLSGRHDSNIDLLDGRDQKILLRSNFGLQISSKIKLSTDLNYTGGREQSGRTAYSPIGKRPYMMLVNDHGDALGYAPYRTGFVDTLGAGLLMDWNFYPLTDYKHTQFTDQQHAVLLSSKLDYNVWNALKMSMSYRYEQVQMKSSNLSTEESFFVRDLINRYAKLDFTKKQVHYGIPKGGIMDQFVNSSSVHNFRIGGEYDKKWRDFMLHVLFGMEIRQQLKDQNVNRYYGFDEENYSISKVDYINSYKHLITNGNIYVPFIDDKSMYTNRFVSQYLNAAFSIKEKYVISGSLRRDASNLFGVKTNDKWQPLWSLAGRWNIISQSQHSLSWIDDLSLRLSYGVSGNVNQSQSAVTTIRYQNTDSYTNFPKAFINQFMNPSLRWEKNKMWNIGTNFSILNRHIQGRLDLYSKRGEDLFGVAPIDYTAVPSKGIMRNVADMKGRGVELELSGFLNLGRRITIQPQFLLNVNHSEVSKYYTTAKLAYESISNGTSVNGLIGYPVYSFMSYKWRGLDEFGDPMGEIDGDKSKDYNAIRTQDKSTLQYSGSALPLYSGYFNPLLRIGAFDMMVGLSYKFGHVFKRESVRYNELTTMNALGIGSGDFEKRWQQSGDENRTDVPAYVYPVNGNRNHFYENSDILILKADHIRIQNIIIGYDWRMQNTMKGRIYVSATNLGILWNSNSYDIDPDYPNMYPTGKQYALGIKIDF